MTLRSTKFYTGSDSSGRSSIASTDGSWEGAIGSKVGAEGPEGLDALGEGVATGLRRANIQPQQTIRRTSYPSNLNPNRASIASFLSSTSTPEGIEPPRTPLLDSPSSLSPGPSPSSPPVESIATTNGGRMLLGGEMMSIITVQAPTPRETIESALSTGSGDGLSSPMRTAQQTSFPFPRCASPLEANSSPPISRPRSYAISPPSSHPNSRVGGNPTSRPNSSLSFHRLSRTYSTPSAPLPSMLVASSSSSSHGSPKSSPSHQGQDANSSTNSSPRQPYHHIPRSQSPIGQAPPSSHLIRARSLVRARTSSGLPGAAPTLRERRTSTPNGAGVTFRTGEPGAGSAGESREAVKKMEKRRKVGLEIYESEKVYVEGLGVIIEHFLKPLHASTWTSYPILPKETIKDIFLNVTEIHAFSSELLSAFASSSLIAPQINPPSLATSAVESPSGAPTDPIEATSRGAVPPNSVRAATTTSSDITPLTLPHLQAQHLITSIPELPSPASSIKLLPSPLRVRPLSLPPSLPSTPILAHPSLLPFPSSSTSSDTPKPPPTLSSVLLSHAPFLSLYHPYISNFQTSSASLAKLRKENRTFEKWLKDREKQEECRKLRLGDWMLSVVQRVPRYRLLIADLLSATPADDPERKDLENVLKTVERITDALNERLNDIAATQKLVALHRSFTNVPSSFSFVVPGRRLLRQGGLLKSCRKSHESRTFWLFTDCLVYGSTNSSSNALVNSSSVAANLWAMGSSLLISSPPPNGSSSNGFPSSSSGYCHFKGGTSSVGGAGGGSAGGQFVRQRQRSKSFEKKESKPIDTTGMSSAGEKGKYVFRRKIELEELTVVEVADSGETRFSFELLSPEKSFAVYACSQKEKESWVEAIRDARMDLLASLRTLDTKIEHTMRRHRRRSLQAIPFASSLTTLTLASTSYASPKKPPPPPSRMQTSPPTRPSPRKTAVSMSSAGPATVPWAGLGGSEREGSDEMGDMSMESMDSIDLVKPGSTMVSQGTVETFIAAVWVPDHRTERCMRCHERFTWLRRRHHCRLCGLVCCHWCSTKSFKVNDSSNPESSTQPVRACDACYESVFGPMYAHNPSPDSPLPTPTSSQMRVPSPLSHRHSEPSPIAIASTVSSVSILQAKRPTTATTAATSDQVGEDNRERPPSLTMSSDQHNSHDEDSLSTPGSPRTPIDAPVPLPPLPSAQASPSASHTRTLDDATYTSTKSSSRGTLSSTLRSRPLFISPPIPAADLALSTSPLPVLFPSTSINRASSTATFPAAVGLPPQPQPRRRPTSSIPTSTSGLATLRRSSPPSFPASPSSKDPDPLSRARPQASPPPIDNDEHIPPPNPNKRPSARRRLSNVNDRFSVFVGGGQGGLDWAGRGEIISPSRIAKGASSEAEARRRSGMAGEVGKREVDVSKGEAVGRLKEVLKEAEGRGRG